MSPAAFWAGGRIVEAAGARADLLWRGVQYGEGLFETLLCLDGRPVFLDEHLERLAASAGALEIPFQEDAVDWRGVAAELARRVAPEGPARVKIFLLAAEGEWGAPCREAEVRLAAFPVDRAEADRRRLDGLRAAAVPGLFGGPFHAHKTLGFLPNLLLAREARRRGAEVGLFLDEEGRIAEGETASVFAVTGGALLTPPLGLGILPGVTRAKILELAAAAGLPCSEETFGHDDLRAAAEAFLTSSVAGVVPLVELDGRPVVDGAPGPVTRRVQELYGVLVREAAGGVGERFCKRFISVCSRVCALRNRGS